MGRPFVLVHGAWHGGWCWQRVTPLLRAAGHDVHAYSVHWDRADNLRNGIGSRVINQGPLNLGYIANMLMAWAGTTSIRRLVVSFGNPVFDGDRVVARGIVTHLEMHHDEQLATCEVWLDRDGERVVWGTATVCLPTRPPTPPATRPPTQQLSVSDDDRNHAPSRWPQRDRNYT